MVQTWEDSGTKTRGSQVETFPLRLWSTTWVQWLDSLKACMLQHNMSSMVTGGYDKGEAMDGWVLYLSLMSLAAWRGEAERERKRRHTERRENWVGTHHVVTEHKKSLVAALNSLLVQQHEKDRLNPSLKWRNSERNERDVSSGQLPGWNHRSRRSTASDWPAPAAPPNSPVLWNRRSADSDSKHTHTYRVTSANSYIYIIQTMGLLCSLLTLFFHF